MECARWIATARASHDYNYSERQDDRYSGPVHLYPLFESDRTKLLWINDRQFARAFHQEEVTHKDVACLIALA